VAANVGSTSGGDPSAAAAAPGFRELANLVYLDQAGRQEHLDLYLPSSPATAGGYPLILALPGGGWRWVLRSSLGDAVSQFARYGYAVAVADYAWASSTPGTHIWPTDFLDVRQAVRWLKAHADRFGIDPNRVAVWGESAGGNLAALVGTFPDGPVTSAGGVSSDSRADADVSARVQAVVDFYGPADLASLYQEAPRTRPYLLTFLGGSPAQVPQRYADASPVDHVSASSPPFLIEQGTADTANVPDQSVKLAQTLQAAGVPYHLQVFPGLPHGFRLLPEPGVDLVPQILNFLDAALNHHGQGIS
jgi:acetyl esterase/lipase